MKRRGFLKALLAGTALVVLAPIKAVGKLVGIYGDGSDGNVVIEGTTVLTRDMNYKSLTIRKGGALRADGYRVKVRGMLNIETGSGISA